MTDEAYAMRHTAYQKLAVQVVDRVKSGRPRRPTVGGGAPADDVWEAFKKQIHEGESLFFEASEETIQALCARTVDSLPDSALAALWLHTGAWHQHQANREHHAGALEMRAGIAHELYQRVCSIAADEGMAGQQSEDNGEEPADD